MNSTTTLLTLCSLFFTAACGAVPEDIGIAESELGPATCGNAQMDPGEECDDGDPFLPGQPAVSGDGCSKYCQIERNILVVVNNGDADDHVAVDICHLFWTNLPAGCESLAPDGTPVDSWCPPHTVCRYLASLHADVTVLSFAPVNPAMSWEWSGSGCTGPACSCYFGTFGEVECRADAWLTEGYRPIVFSPDWDDNACAHDPDCNP